MEEKMVKIPFDIERAKRIQAGEEPGRIVTLHDCKVEIVRWNVKNEQFPIIGIVTVDGREYCCPFTAKGRICEGSISPNDIEIKVPECTQYKEGDILVTCFGSIFIYKGMDYDTVSAYAVKFTYEKSACVSETIGKNFCTVKQIKGYATYSQKYELFNALKESKDDRAEEYLKRFFGVEEKPKCEFQPYDRVLVRCLKEEKWLAAFFSHYDPDRSFPYRTTGDCDYTRCIPYNEKTKRLVGTTDEWND